MATFEHGDMRIHYEEQGSGHPVLLLPGWGGTTDELAPLRDALGSAFRVIAADVPGSGRSGPKPRTYTPSYYEDDARLFLAMLDAIEASPAHIVGFSDGGEYGLLMSALQPTAVRSVVAWGAAGSMPDAPELTEAFASLVDAPIPPLAGFSAYLKATYGDSTARVMVSSAAAAQRAIMAAGGDISHSRAGDITCPVLLIAGEHDFLATPAAVSEMALAISRGEFVQADGAGHPVHLERPDWLRDTIVGWLSRY